MYPWFIKSTLVFFNTNIGAGFVELLKFHPCLCAEYLLLTLFRFIYSKYDRSDNTCSLNSRSYEGCPSGIRLYSQDCKEVVLSRL